MKIEANTFEDYISQIPEERQEIFTQMIEVIRQNLPDGFHEQIHYNMPAWVVPHSIFPDGYHCDPKLPLPFLNLGNQKNYIALYHMGVYSDSKIYDWFVEEYPKHCQRKLDMGKSCIRFKKMDDIPLKLIGELVTKMNVQDWIEKYTRSRSGEGGGSC